LLGPVTRFQERGRDARVQHEIAGVTFYVENQREEGLGVSEEGVVLYAEDEVRVHSIILPIHGS
jgi:hypothetical protein